MLARRWFVFALLLPAACGAAVWFSARSNRSRDVLAELPSERGIAGPPPRLASNPPTVATTADLSEAPDRPHRVEGSVVVVADGPEDALASEIDFQVESGERSRRGHRTSALPPTQTVNGRELLLADAPGGSLWRVSAATRDGRYAAAHLHVRIPTNEHSALVERIELRRMGSVSGIVRGPGGQPVAGAQLSATNYDGSNPRPPSVTTDAEGRYRMPALGDFILRCRGSGLASTYQQVAWIEEGKDQLVDLTLGEPWELTGVATDTFGTHLSGLVCVSSFAGGDEVALDASGRFRFPNLPRGMTQVVVCYMTEEGSQGDWVQLPEDPPANLDVGTLVFDVKRKLDVRVVDADGTALHGIPLGVIAEGEHWSTAFTSTIALGTGRYTIRARGVEASATIQVAREPLPSPLILVAKNVIQVRGRVVYEGSESPDLSDLVYLVQGPPSIAARDAITRGEPVAPSADADYRDDGNWPGRPVAPDGTISFCVPRDWHEVLVIVGPPAHGHSKSTLESEIATARVPTDRGQVEIRISPQHANRIPPGAAGR